MDWLTDICARLSGRSFGLVATHGDLTMSNVLVDGAGPLAVVDWENARATGLPLTDLYYAAADAHAAAARYRRRADSLIATLDSRSEYGRFVSTLAHHVDSATLGDPLLHTFAVHALAIRHAADEHVKNRPGSQPFVSLARWLAGRTSAQHP